MLPAPGTWERASLSVPQSRQFKCPLFSIWADGGTKRPSQLTMVDKTKVIYCLFDFERQLETHSGTYNRLCPSGNRPKPPTLAFVPAWGLALGCADKPHADRMV